MRGNKSRRLKGSEMTKLNTCYNMEEKRKEKTKGFSDT